MIEILSGLPGGGKSFLAMLRIIEALRFEMRHVLTNVSLDHRALAWYLSWKPKYLFSKDPLERASRAREIDNRIHILGEEDVKHFWDYCYGGRARNFLIVLDEIQLYFASEDWAKAPAEFKSYLAQHRKGGDDLILISQHTKNVDVHFRRMCARYWHCHNTKGMPLWGVVPLPEAFVANSYYGEVNQVMSRRFYKPNKKIYSLYDSWKEYETAFNKDDKDEVLLELDMRNKKMPFYMKAKFHDLLDKSKEEIKKILIDKSPAADYQLLAQLNMMQNMSAIYEGAHNF